MLFLRLLPLAIAAYGIWELRAIRKVHQARWDYERLKNVASYLDECDMLKMAHKTLKDFERHSAAHP